MSVPELDIAASEPNDLERPLSHDTVVEPSAATHLITIRPFQVFQCLAMFVAVVAITGTAANYFIYHIAPTPQHEFARVARRLDLGHEPSFPGWYSSIALLTAGGLLALIARIHWDRREYFARPFFVLALIFLYLAIDEAIMIHEMVDTALRMFFDTHGLLRFAWVIPAFIAAGLVGVMNLRFLTKLPSRTRNLFILAGCLFVTGAAGMEMLAGVAIENSGVDGIEHTFVQFVEEGLEMIAIAVFIYGLLNYIERNWPTLTFEVTQST